MADLSAVRDPKTGVYDKHADGGYPLYYLDGDGCTLCAVCAAKETEGSLAVVDYGIHYEGEPLICEDCGAEIPSAYGPVTE